MKKIFVLLLFVTAPVSVFAMRDAAPPVYGRPTLYGEYEINAEDVARASHLYGDAPRTASIRVIPNAKKVAVAKHPVKAKKAKSKKMPVKKKMAKPKSDSVVAVGPIVPDAPQPKETPAVKKEVHIAPPPAVPSGDAVSIAGAVRANLDESSYCVRRAKHGRGVPDGFVLMPGRPDLMSCVSHE